MFVSIYSMFTDSSSKEKDLDNTTEFRELLKCRTLVKEYDAKVKDAEAKRVPPPPAPDYPAECTAEKRDAGAKIAKIAIERKGRDDARYVVSLKDNTTKQVVHAEFKDSFINEIKAAGISYTVKSKDDSSIWPQVLVWWLPMLLLVGIFFL